MELNIYCEIKYDDIKSCKYKKMVGSNYCRLHTKKFKDFVLSPGDEIRKCSKCHNYFIIEKSKDQKTCNSCLLKLHNKRTSGKKQCIAMIRTKQCEKYTLENSEYCSYHQNYTEPTLPRCTNCGKPNNNPDFKTCNNCRVPSKQKKKIKDMTIEEQREYNRLRKRNQRLNKK